MQVTVSLFLAIVLAVLYSCVEDRRISPINEKLSGSLSSATKDFVSSEEAKKKVDIKKLVIPRECSTFTLYLQENCQGTKASNSKCVRANEYNETCKQMFGSCGIKQTNQNQSQRIVNIPLSITSIPQDSIEMKFLSSVSNSCDKMSLTLVMCNTQSYYEECSSCQSRLELFDSCAENPDDPSCAPLAEYLNECPQPCN